MSQPSARDLGTPNEVESDPNAIEILRAWVAGGGLVCALRPDAWNEPAAWGIVLADAARHIANATQQLTGADPTDTLAQITSIFNRELIAPTDTPEGRFEN